MPVINRTENYSIEGIAQSIVKDHPVSQKFTPDNKLQLYNERLSKLDSLPDLKAILSFDHINNYNNSYVKDLIRLVVIPPEIVVVDTRIQDMCALPYWTYFGSSWEGSFGPCSGIGAFSCCPPFTLNAEKVQAKLDQSDLFLVMQTRLRNFVVSEPGDQERTINRLSNDIDGLLGKGSVIQKFGGGLCMACAPEPCECEGKCCAPSEKVPSLESLGVCVDQLCKDCGHLTKDPDWPIIWIKGFGGPDQSPMQSKATIAIAIKI